MLRSGWRGHERPIHHIDVSRRIEVHKYIGRPDGHALVLLAKAQMCPAKLVGVPMDQDKFSVRVIKAQQVTIRAEKRPSGRERWVAARLGALQNRAFNLAGRAG